MIEDFEPVFKVFNKLYDGLFFEEENFKYLLYNFPIFTLPFHLGKILHIIDTRYDFDHLMIDLLFEDLMMVEDSDELFYSADNNDEYFEEGDRI